MHQDNLRFLYREYKNCLKNEFSNYFPKDDEYKSYFGRCLTQQIDIRKYYLSNYLRFGDVSHTREQEEIHNNYESNFTKFGKHGWNSAQIKNYFLNIDRSKEEHDVWINHILAAHNEADWGLYNIYTQNENNMMKEFKKSLKSINPNPSFVQSYKWTGKPSDDWNRIDHFAGNPKIVQ